MALTDYVRDKVRLYALAGLPFDPDVTPFFVQFIFPMVGPVESDPVVRERIDEDTSALDVVEEMTAQERSALAARLRR